MASEPPPAAAAKPPLDLPDPGNLRPLRDGLILKPEDVADNAPEKEEVKRQVLEEMPLVTRQKPYFYSFEQREIDETVCMVGALSTNRPKSELGASRQRDIFMQLVNVVEQ